MVDFRDGLQRLDVLARVSVGDVIHDERLQSAPLVPLNRLVGVGGARLERVEVGQPRHERRVLHLEVEAQIGLVAAVEIESVLPCDAVKLGGQVVAERLFEDVAHHSLGDGKHLVAACEAHLHVNLRELGLAVAPRVLVTVAAGNLKIFVEAAHHEELLVELRRLRERVEFSRMDPAWHKVVARAFRRGLDERGRLDFQKSPRCEVLAHGERDLRAQDDVLLHRLSAQVKVAVFEAQVLVGKDERAVFLAHFFYREGQLLARGEDFDVRCLDLNLAGRHIAVDVLVAPGADCALHGDAELALEAGGGLSHVVACAVPHHHLRDSVAVPQADKQEPAQVARAAHPSVQNNFPAHICRAKLAAGGCALCAFHNEDILVIMR